MGDDDLGLIQARTVSKGGRFRVSLLGGFAVTREGCPITELTGGSQRLLAFLALRDRPTPRTAAASAFWPEAAEEHANASLRSAISRLPAACHEAIQVTFHDIGLSPTVEVDLHESKALAHRLLGDGATLRPADLSAAAIEGLSADLLPGWYEDWAVAESEMWRQLRLHALEVLARRLICAGRFSDATSAALETINAGPLRESAHAVLIRVHLAEGNQSEAVAAFTRYRSLLRSELGLEPTRRLSELVGGTADDTRAIGAADVVGPNSEEKTTPASKARYGRTVRAADLRRGKAQKSRVSGSRTDARGPGEPRL